MKPSSSGTESVTSSRHVPRGLRPYRVASESCGRNRPVKGGVPPVIGVLASESKIVPWKSSPAPPTRVNSRTRVPSGATSTADK